MMCSNDENGDRQLEMQNFKLFMKFGIVMHLIKLEKIIIKLMDLKKIQLVESAITQEKQK